MEDWRVKENSNMSYSLQGLNNYLSSTVIAKYWITRIYPPNIADAHFSGDMHIHDLGVLGPYCVGWDIKDLLLTGFGGVPGKIESVPAKHFRTALGQVVNFFYTLQGEAAGAQAFSNFDTYLAPFIRYDGLSQKEVEQSLQEFFFNMNVPTRVGFQTPFTNVTLDLKVPDFMKDEPVIIGGEFKDATYGDMEKEMEIFNIAFAKVLSQGDAKGRVFTFPIPTYCITKDFDWDSPISKEIFEVAAKYGAPYFSNFVNSDMKPEDVRSMCCRLRIDNRELRKRGGGFFGANPLTGSIGVVTLNLPRIGYLAKNEDEFFERLEALMEIAKDSLEIKRKVLEQFTEKGLYPYSRRYLKGVKETFGKYWKNHFSTIGLVGMNEAILNLFGYGIATKDGLEFAVKVLNFMREKLADFQEETGNIYNLEATPAEGASYRLARIDKRKYPDIIVANEKYLARGAEPFYTNSSQLPVDHDADLFEALEHQDRLQTLFTGGTVFHIYLGERLYSWRAAAELVRKVAWNFRLPYFTLTPTFSICPTHGYISGEHKQCPKCGANCEVYSRVVGYLRPVDQWNDGKQAEFAIRKTFEKAAVLPPATVPAGSA
jgi:ribonucleoside-triphosphate reductase